MLLIYGIRKIKIKTYDDPHIRCEHCHDFGQRFSVYQDCFHVFFIPLLPMEGKTIQSACLKCNDRFNSEKKNHYLSITRTPVYMYAWPILFVVLIAALVMGNVYTHKQKAAYVADPKINDVYLIRQEENESATYYFMKIKSIHADTVELLSGHLQYHRFPSTMDASDYFVDDEAYDVLKSDLRKYITDGMINSVKRNETTNDEHP